MAMIVGELSFQWKSSYWRVTHWAAVDPGAIAFLGTLADSVGE